MDANINISPSRPRRERRPSSALGEARPFRLLLSLLLPLLAWGLAANAAEVPVHVVNGVAYQLGQDDSGANIAAVCKQPEGKPAYAGAVSVPARVAIEGVSYRVMSVAPYAFKDCATVSSVSLPSGLAAIAPGAFCGCAALTAFQVPASATSVDVSAFIGCDKLTTITVAGGNATYQAQNGMLLSRDGRRLLRCPTGMRGTARIPATVTDIASQAFSGCAQLTGISFPDGLLTIGSDAFAGCVNLANIKVPDSVVSAGASAFADCGSVSSQPILSSGGKVLLFCPRTLTGVYDVPKSVERINEHAFEGCTQLVSVTLPDGLKVLGEAAFCHCTSLKSLNVTTSVESVGANAFAHCASLKAVNIGCSDHGEGHRLCANLADQLTNTLPDKEQAVVTTHHELFIDWNPDLEVLGGQEVPRTAVVWDGTANVTEEKAEYYLGGDRSTTKLANPYIFKAGSRPATVSVTVKAKGAESVTKDFVVAKLEGVTIDWTPAATTVEGNTKPDFSAAATPDVPVVYSINGRDIDPETYLFPPATAQPQKIKIKARTDASPTHTAATPVEPTFTIPALVQVKITWRPTQTTEQTVIEGDRPGLDGTATDDMPITYTLADGTVIDDKWAFPPATNADQHFVITAATEATNTHAAATEVRKFVVKKLIVPVITWNVASPLTVIGGTEAPLTATVEPQRELFYTIEDYPVEPGWHFEKAKNVNLEVTVVCSTKPDKTHAAAVAVTKVFEITSLIKVQIHWMEREMGLNIVTGTYNPDKFGYFRPHLDGTTTSTCNNKPVNEQRAITYTLSDDQGERVIDDSYYFPPATHSDYEFTITATTDADPTHEAAKPTVTRNFKIAKLLQPIITWTPAQTQVPQVVTAGDKVALNGKDNVCQQPVIYDCANCGTGFPANGGTYVIPPADEEDHLLVINANTEHTPLHEVAPTVTKQYLLKKLIHPDIRWYVTQGDDVAIVEAGDEISFDGTVTDNLKITYTRTSPTSGEELQGTKFVVPAADEEDHLYTYVATTEADKTHAAAVPQTRYFKLLKLRHPVISWRDTQTGTDTYIDGDEIALDGVETLDGLPITYTLTDARGTREISGSFVFPAATDDEQLFTIVATTEADKTHAAAAPVTRRFRVAPLIHPAIQWPDLFAGSDIRCKGDKIGFNATVDDVNIKYTLNGAVKTPGSTFTFPPADNTNDLTYEFVASTEADETHAAATLSRTITVRALIHPVIKWNPTLSVKGGQSPQLTATASMPITYALADGTPVTASYKFVAGDADKQIDIIATTESDKTHASESATRTFTVAALIKPSFAWKNATTIDGGTSFNGAAVTPSDLSVRYTFDAAGSNAVPAGYKFTAGQTVTIYAFTDKDDTRAAGKSDCKFTVRPLIARTVTWTKQSTGVVDGGTLKFGATVTPAAGPEIKYYVNGKEISGHTFVGGETLTVYARVAADDTHAAAETWLKFTVPLVKPTITWNQQSNVADNVPVVFNATVSPDGAPAVQYYLSGSTTPITSYTLTGGQRVTIIAKTAKHGKYDAAEKSLVFDVPLVQPTITWNKQSNVKGGVPVSLDADVDPSSLSLKYYVGSTQITSRTFVAGETVTITAKTAASGKYAAAEKSLTYTVPAKTTPVISWNPSTQVSGGELISTYLTATATDDVPVSYYYDNGTEVRTNDRFAAATTAQQTKRITAKFGGDGAHNKATDVSVSFTIPAKITQQQSRLKSLEASDEYYDINGNRLTEPQKGISIVGGKLVLIK